MNWKSLKQNPPTEDETYILLKYPEKENRGTHQYDLATFFLPDPDEPQLGAFLIVRGDPDWRDLSALSDTLLYITLDEIK